MSADDLDDFDDLDLDLEEGEEEEEVEELQLSEATAGSGSTIIVNDRFHISADQPLPELDSPTAQAFHCRDTADINHTVFALVSTGLLPPRGEDLLAFRRIDRESLLSPIEWGVSDWPGSDHRRFVVVVERPGGRRIAEHFNDHFSPFNEDRITRNVIRPLLPVLKDLQESHVAHRSIRIDNLFYKDAVLGEVVLGEGFSAPPAMHQPVVCEPIDSSMAEPGGRGPGSSRDDMYSFGILLAMLLMGRNPLADTTDDRIIERKLAEGSYSALLGDARIPLSLMEVLRGLLTDDARERWNVAELEMWLNGRRLSPKQPKLAIRAQRPFSFQGVDYLSTPTLAHAFVRNWSAATKSIANDAVDVWIRRGFEDDELASAFNSSIRSAAAFGGRRGIEDRMVARACVVLDPLAPVRYRQFSARIDGYPTALMARYIKNGDVREIAETANSKLPIYWIETQEVQTPEQNLLRRNFEMMTFMLGRGTIGYGLERCLYELNPSCPCISPMVEKHFVLHINQMLTALDHAAVERSGKGEPIDRHIAAFIASKLKHPMDQHLQGLSSEFQSARRLALIRLLAEVQQYTAEETPFHLAQWLVKLADPIVDTYFNRSFRERLRKEIKKIAEKGTLMDLAYALENTARRDRDTEGFRDATADYTEAENEIQKIEGGEMTKPEVVEKKGQEVAAMASGVIASFAMIFILLFKTVLG